MYQSPDFYQAAIENSFLIVNKETQAVNFKLNEPQSKILHSLQSRDIILKARQEGISSLLLAIFAIDFLTIENIRCVVISHESSATQKLFDKVKYYLESLKKTFPGELPYKLKYNSRSELVNTEKNSTFYIGTAGARAFGRGDVINNLHISELAFWQNQEKLMIGLMQTVPREGQIVIETTANGVGDYFFNLWKRAQHPSSPFKAHFLAWFNLKEYQMPIYGEFIPTKEEQELAQIYKLTNEQLNWRRYKIGELGGDPFGEPPDSFLQEYPSNPNEAFIVSGNPIWPPSTLKWYERRCVPPERIGNLSGGYEVIFDENPKGNLKVWKEPVAFHEYVIGADIAEGIEVNSDDPVRDKRLDYSCAVVMDRKTVEIVAVWHGRVDPDQMGRQLEALGRWYNDAFIGVEKNNHGLSSLLVLRELNYPKIYYREKEGLASIKSTNEMGWRTDRYTRPLMIDEGSKWFRERRLMIYDEEIIGEMMSFVRYPDGVGRAAQNAYDDRIMAMLIALQMYTRNPVTEKGNPIERPDNPSIFLEEDDMMAGLPYMDVDM